MYSNKYSYAKNIEHDEILKHIGQLIDVIGIAVI